MIPFIGFSGPYIFGNEFWRYNKDLSDFERIVHETGDGGEGGDGFTEAHFDENAGGWICQDVIDDVELVGMEVSLVHVGCWIADVGCIGEGHSVVILWSFNC